MTPEKVTELVAGLLKQCGHPDIEDVTATSTNTVKAKMVGGSANYVPVAHVQAANARTPDRPSWPGHVTAGVAERPNR